MKTYRKVLEIRTDRRRQAVDITARVEEAVRESGIREGFVLVYPHHTTAGVCINDSDPNITEDLLDVLAGLVPAGAGYRHDLTDPKANADGHIQGTLASHHVTVPITGGACDLGTYQRIYYLELDGMRTKEVVLKLLGV